MYDVIGDLHGCMDELRALLGRLGYDLTESGGRYALTHPQGRKLVYIGDIADRGPFSADALAMAIDTVGAGAALCVCGNHDRSLWQKLSDRSQPNPDTDNETLRQIDARPPEFAERVRDFLSSLPSHLVLDDGGLVAAHAGLREDLWNKDTPEARELALDGPPYDGRFDERGHKIRPNWAEDYRGRAVAVSGHTPVYQALWTHNAVNIDTGCVFGGRLTALRYPERETVWVKALRQYRHSDRWIVDLG